MSAFHGDRGQGLTAEFIETYPIEDRNCWTSRCHGDHPYEDGFTLPKNVPAVIGAGTLQKFPNASILRAYIFAAMPYWNPASLSEEETWQLTAFILRENRQWAAQQELNAANADTVLIGTTVAAPTNSQPSSAAIPMLFISGAFILILFFVFQRLRKNKDL